MIVFDVESTNVTEYGWSFGSITIKSLPVSSFMCYPLITTDCKEAFNVAESKTGWAFANKLAAITGV